MLYLQILDKEAVEEVRAKREIPEIKPGYIVQLKVVCKCLLILFLFLLLISVIMWVWVAMLREF